MRRIKLAGGARRHPTTTYILLFIAATLLLAAVRPAYAATNKMPYYGGPTMHTSTAYAIFWLPSGKTFEGFLGSDSRYESLNTRFLTDIGGSSYYNILSQYSDTQNGAILAKSTFGGSYVDTSPYPSNTPSGQDISNEVLQAMNAEGWTGGLTHLFMVFTASGVYAPGAETDYCAYHSWTYTSANEPVVYAYIPDVYSLVGVLGCATIQHLGVTPNLDLWADSAINLVSHELFESVSDPLASAWGTDQSEIGDLCAWQLGPAINILGADLELNGDYYLVQKEWSNYDNTCVLSYGPSTTVSMPLDPSAGSKIGNFNLSYSQMGTRHWTITNSGFQSDTIFVDPNSQLILKGVPAPAGNEKWCFDSSCDAIVFNLGSCIASPCLFAYAPIYYYDLIGQTVGLGVNGGGSPSVPVSYVTASQSIGSTDSPATATFQLTTSPQTFWAQRGSTATVASSVGSATERWASTTSASWVIGGMTTPNLLYYHQFLVTFSYNVLGGGGSIAPSVDFVQFGNYMTTSTGQPVWADAKSLYSYPNLLPGSSATEQWALSSSSEPSGGTVSLAGTISVDYYHQYAVNISYSAVGITSPSPPSITATSLGQTVTTPLPPSVSGFLDAGTSYQISNVLAGPTSSERWFTSSPQDAGTVSGPLTISLTYYHQYTLTLSYGVLGGGTPAPPNFSGTSTGIPFVQALASQPTQVWADENSPYSLQSQLGGSTPTERWVTNSAQTAGTASGPLTISLGYYQQFALTLSFSVSGGTVPGAPTLSCRQFGSSSTAALTASATGYWCDGGQAWSVTNPLLGSAVSERWFSVQTVNGTVSTSLTVTMVYYHQYSFTASYSISGGGSPTAPTFASLTNGRAYTPTLTTTPTTYWLDDGAAWTLSNPLIGSTNSERWQTATTSGTVSAAGVLSPVYNHQYYLTMQASPSAGGSVSPTAGWFDSEASVSVSAIANPGWQFTGWIGSGAGSYTGPLSLSAVTMDGPISQVADFNPATTTTTTTSMTTSSMTSVISTSSAISTTSSTGPSTSASSSSIGTVSSSTSSTSTPSASTTGSPVSSSTLLLGIGTVVVVVAIVTIATFLRRRRGLK